MIYSVHGPFKMKKMHRAIAIDRSSKSTFWSDIESSVPGLSSGIGCYIFSLKNGVNAKPWYVGQTKRLSFKGEIFQAHKIRHYNAVLKTQNAKGIEFFFIAKRTPKGRLTKAQKGQKKTTHTDIDSVETMLIGAALDKNEKLRNIKSTKLFNKLIIPGFINSPNCKPTLPAQYLKRLI